jgi:hypothetical protein
MFIFTFQVAGSCFRVITPEKQDPDMKTQSAAAAHVIPLYTPECCQCKSCTSPV